MTRDTMLALGAIALLGVLSCCCAGLGGLMCSSFVSSVDRDLEYAEQTIPVEDALLEGREPDPELVRRLAANRITRIYLAELLDGYGRFDRMPPEHATDVALAESDLARWLTHPNELDAEPVQMELAAIATIDDPSLGPLRYFAFRFTAPPGHWASEGGWMFGISGPFPPEGAPRRPELLGLGTWSELEPFGDDALRAMVAEMHGAEVSGLPVAPGAVTIEIVPLR